MTVRTDGDAAELGAAMTRLERRVVELGAALARQERKLDELLALPPKLSTILWTNHQA